MVNKKNILNYAECDFLFRFAFQTINVIVKRDRFFKEMIENKEK
jgi:1-deoxy-D-xylulose 5-phosphate reductoisomerase